MVVLIDRLKEESNCCIEEDGMKRRQLQVRVWQDIDDLRMTRKDNGSVSRSKTWTRCKVVMYEVATLLDLRRTHDAAVVCQCKMNTILALCPLRCSTGTRLEHSRLCFLELGRCPLTNKRWPFR